MLKQRVVTALILVTVFLAANFYLNDLWFAAFAALFALLGAHEWARLSGLAGAPGVVVWLALCVVCGVGLYLRPSVGDVLLAAAAVGWAVTGVWLLSRRALPPGGGTTLRLAAGIIVLLPAWYALWRLHAENVWLVVVLAGIVWIADIAAFFSGRRWGRRKLAPALSPGKTIEGLWGALAGIVLFALALGSGWAGAPAPALVVLFLLTGGASVIGDLFESYIKRTAGVKDSGSLLPGHGGVLDRIDSVTAAAPVFASGWLLWIKPMTNA